MWRGLSRALVAVICIAAAGSLGSAALGAAEGAPADGPAWELVGFPGQEIVHISTPRSGALFVQLDQELWRSDDAGLTWRPVPMPSGIFLTPSITVDPYDQTTVYVDMAVTRNLDIGDKVMRTRDEGATWEQILPSAGSDVDSLGILSSEAQPGLLYSVQKGGNLQRSEDGGDNWVDLALPSLPEPKTRMGCVNAFRFYPHPVDPDLIYRVGVCRVNNVLDAPAELPYQTDVSHDRGDTWAPLSPSPFRSVFAQVEGCGPNAPSRLYLMDRTPHILNEPLILPTLLQRSDDGGQSWRLLRGGEGTPPKEAVLEVGCDPTNADRVFLLRAEEKRQEVWVSLDGGYSWGTLALPAGVDVVTDLAVGIDGRYLFLGTRKGLWRLPIFE